MPEINFEELGQRVAGKVSEAVVEGFRGVSDEMKEMAISSQAVSNSMGAMIQTMYNSRYSFSDFMNNLEKTNIMLYSTAKLLGDVSSGFKYATSNVEGLISALQSLSTQTLPDVTKHVAEGVMGYKKRIEVLKEDISHNENLIASMKRNGIETDAWGRSIQDIEKRTAELRVELDDASEKMKTFGEGLNKVLGIITLGITAAIALAQAYDNAIKSKREVIYTLGKMGASYSENYKAMEQFQAGMVQVASRWGMLREEMAKAIAPLSALGVGVGIGGIGASLKDVTETFRVSAEWSGGMFRAHGVEMGITTKALGTLSTTFDLKGKELSEVFGDIYTQGTKSVLGMQRYITEMTSMIETTRRYGGSHESAMLMIGTFEEQLKKGTLSLQDLARLSSPAMWSPQQQGAVVAMMQQYAPAEARGLGIFGQDLISGMVTLSKTSQEQPAILLQGLSKVINAIIPGGATGLQGQFFAQQILQSLLGIQIPVYEVANLLRDPAKFSVMMDKKAGERDTPESILGRMEKDYAPVKTMAERLVPSVDKVRDAVIEVKQTIEKIFGTSEEVKKAFAPPETKSKMADLILSIGSWFGQQFYGKQVERLLAEYPTKQTGGYISETAMYRLEAGEQVRRPGEGGGAINITLGGINVSVGDRGNMRNQLDEAFERLKRETISEIESQWNESLVAH